MKFQDIKRMTIAKYKIDSPWIYFKKHYIIEHNLNLDPDYQRDYVWTDKQKISYIEWILKGGITGKDIYLNHPGWMKSFKGDFEVVDGKQRITAVLDFLDNKFPVFGKLYKEFEDKLPIFEASFNIHINNLENRKDIIQWYLDMNTCGVSHTDEEINKVKNILKKL